MEKNYKDEILTELKTIRKSLKRTENNVAFFAILMIISLVLSALIGFLSLKKCNYEKAITFNHLIHDRL